jgi:cell division septation protein DedD
MAWRSTIGGYLVAFWVMGTGCASHSRSVPPPDLPTAMPSEQEASRVIPGAGEAIPNRSPAPAPIPSGEADATGPIYRVQLVATSNAALAQRRAEEFRGRFAEPVRVDTEDGLFKVRVGACADRETAAALQRKVTALGVSGAFIVEIHAPAR